MLEGAGKEAAAPDDILVDLEPLLMAHNHAVRVFARLVESVFLFSKHARHEGSIA